MKQTGREFDSGCSLADAPPPCEIVGLRYLPLSGEFEATVIERNVDGEEIGKMVAASKSLSRLVEIIRPAAPVNL